METGIYDVTTSATVAASSKIQARCDMESNGGGWTVLVRRTPDVDERVNFKRGWTEYENGFWYGLKYMHYLTSQEPVEVQVELKKTDGTKRILTYGNFKINGPDTKYTLQVSDPKQGGFNPFAHHNGRKFSTAERDNDNHGGNCVTRYNTGGWWYGGCYDLCLTGTKASMDQGGERYIQYEYAELRVRPKSCLKKTPTCHSE